MGWVSDEWRSAVDALSEWDRARFASDLADCEESDIDVDGEDDDE